MMDDDDWKLNARIEVQLKSDLEVEERIRFVSLNIVVNAKKCEIGCENSCS